MAARGRLESVVNFGYGLNPTGLCFRSLLFSVDSFVD